MYTQVGLWVYLDLEIIIWLIQPVTFNTAQKLKFFIKYFFSKSDVHLLKKSWMENFIFCAV